MASSANQDSHLQIDFQPSPDTGLTAPTGAAPAAARSPQIPVFDLASQAPLPELPDGPLAPRTPDQTPALDQTPDTAPPSPAAHGGIWLNGDVLMCSCPDCAAPMTIRLWLMLADCWQCGLSIELTEEQEREALRLLEHRWATGHDPARHRAAQHAASPAADTPTSVKPGHSGAAPESRHQDPTSQPESQPPESQRPETTRRRHSGDRQRETQTAVAAPPRPLGEPPIQPSAEPPAANPAAAILGTSADGTSQAASERIRQLVSARTSTAWLSDFFDQTPAWLVSLVFHLILITLLALFTFPDEENRSIRLAVAVSANVREGGNVDVVDPLADVTFDLPIPREFDLEKPDVRRMLVRADQDARELRIDPDASDPQLPPLEIVRQQINGAAGLRQALAARDPRLRVEMVQREGGTTLTEAAVARGLRWLAMHQADDGSWSLHSFNRGCSCRGQGDIQSDSAATSLALLPFLGAGQTHLTGRYKDVVSRGLRWMLEHQKENGDLRHFSARNSGMYAHGQGTIVLCEAFLLTGDEQLRVPAQKAVDFIAAAQYSDGGWRYYPAAEVHPNQQISDTSVIGWQWMALQSARSANLSVDDDVLGGAAQYLDSVASEDGALYAYMRGQRPTHVMTAEALLCRIYQGWTKDRPALIDGVEFLADQYPPDRKNPNIYYWYYGAQTFHHIGGSLWDDWNRGMRDVLVQMQQTSGHQAGSWSPEGPHSVPGGRVYMTSLAVCCLEVYYRHLPIFRQLDLD